MKQLRGLFREKLVAPQAMIAQLGAAAEAFFLGDTQVFPIAWSRHRFS
jgi:hypothetical protein